MHARELLNLCSVMLLGQKSCRTKVPRIFRISVPNFAPNFAPNFPRILRGLFVLRFVGDGDQKKFTKNPRHFSMQNSPGKHEKIFTKFFWRAGKLTCWQNSEGSTVQKMLHVLFDSGISHVTARCTCQNVQPKTFANGYYVLITQFVATGRDILLATMISDSVVFLCNFIFDGGGAPAKRNCAFTEAASIPARRESENAGPRLFGLTFRRCPPSRTFSPFFELSTKAAFAKADF